MYQRIYKTFFSERRYLLSDLILQLWRIAETRQESQSRDAIKHQLRRIMRMLLRTKVGFQTDSDPRALPTLHCDPS